MNLFKGKIKCKSCGKNFNFKPDHGQDIYICSGYKNYGSSFCARNRIKEQDLINIIEKHIRLKEDASIQISLEEISSHVVRIEVLQEHITIYYSDSSTSEWNNDKLLI